MLTLLSGFRGSGPFPRRATGKLNSFSLALALNIGLVFLLVDASWAQKLDLNIYHIDVGQGDATLIVSPSGHTLLIDGGNTGKGRRNVLPLLHELGLDRLDYVIATHYDADHIGGLDEVLDGIEQVNQAVFDRGEEEGDLPATDAYADYVNSAGTTRKTILPGTTLNMGTEISVQCVAVNGQVAGTRAQPAGTLDENGRSVALVIRYDQFDYFIGGDLTGGGLSGTRRTADVESVAAREIGDVDVLRVSHHGSTTSSNEHFLESLSPEVAVISVGTDGVNLRYRHPSRDVLNRLHDLPGLAAVFQTNRGNTAGGLRARDRELIEVTEGNIVLSTDGSRYVIHGQTRAVDEE